MSRLRQTNKHYQGSSVVEHQSVKLEGLSSDSTRIKMFLSDILLNAMKYEIRCMEDNREGLELNGINQLLVYADDVASLGNSEEVLI